MFRPPCWSFWMKFGRDLLLHGMRMGSILSRSVRGRFQAKRWGLRLYRASCVSMLACRARYWWHIRPFVRLYVNHSGIVLKWMNIPWNSFHHLVEEWLVFECYRRYKMQGRTPSGVKYKGIGKICDFRQKSPIISETVRDRSIATMDH